MTIGHANKQALVGDCIGPSVTAVRGPSRKTGLVRSSPYARTSDPTRRQPELRITRVKAKNVREGDEVVVTVSRVLGVQGRKPRSGSPLMKLEYEDGSTETLREDDAVEILRP